MNAFVYAFLMDTHCGISTKKKKKKNTAGRAKEWQEKHTANEAPETEGTSLPTSLQARGVDIS